MFDVGLAPRRTTRQIQDTAPHRYASLIARWKAARAFIRCAAFSLCGAELNSALSHYRNVSHVKLQCRLVDPRWAAFFQAGPRRRNDSAFSVFCRCDVTRAPGLPLTPQPRPRRLKRPRPSTRPFLLSVSKPSSAVPCDANRAAFWMHSCASAENSAAAARSPHCAAMSR